ncbi:histidine phosphatase family protein [Streptacidiphilus sp. EB103A]|uniref:histidine phosphatase family protein n=1 Tax=Streptacidiphilus sp. EB103A TaxID=3156275 RepID=UPI003513E76B
MSLEIIVESHATTSDNEAGLATGWLPGTLSELGRQQAVELGFRHHGGVGLTAVLTSDLNRTIQTAQLAFPDGGSPLRQDLRLRECDYGRLNPCSTIWWRSGTAPTPRCCSSPTPPTAGPSKPCWAEQIWPPCYSTRRHGNQIGASQLPARELA